MGQLAPQVEIRIAEARVKRVMLDSDLATLYGVETKVLLQQVRRNAKRFLDDFMFRLSNDEWEILRSQFVTSRSGWGGRRSLPYAFTEHGVAMLSSVLRSDRAIAVNIEIMRAFVAMRHSDRSLGEIADRLDRLERLAGSRLKAHEAQLSEVFAVLRQLTATPSKRHHPIGFRIRKESD